MSSGAFAESAGSQRNENLGLGIGAVAGTILGGPFGFIVGSIAGAHFGWKEDQKNSKEALAHEETIEVAATQQKQTEKAPETRAGEVIKSDPAAGRYPGGKHVTVNKMVNNQEILTGILFPFSQLEMMVHFRTDSAVIERQYLRLLSRIRLIMKKYPLIRISLQGHADPRGSDSYNKELSKLRLQRIRLYLLESGVSPERVYGKPYGEKNRETTSDDLDSYALDRRVVVTFVVPGY